MKRCVMTTWQVVGYIGVALFALAIVAIGIARHLFKSPNEKNVGVGETVIGSLGGPKRYREASSERRRRFAAK